MSAGLLSIRPLRRPWWVALSSVLRRWREAIAARRAACEPLDPALGARLLRDVGATDITAPSRLSDATRFECLRAGMAPDDAVYRRYY